MLKVKVTSKVKIFIGFSSWPYPLNSWTFCNQTRGDASSGANVMQKDWFAIFRVEVSGLLSSGSRSQWGFIIMCDCFYHIHWAGLLFWQLNLIEWHMIFWSVLCKNLTFVFKVKVTVKVQILIRSLCILYFLYHWTVGNQTKCVDVLWLIIQVQQSGHILRVIPWLTVLQDTHQYN